MTNELIAAAERLLSEAKLHQETLSGDDDDGFHRFVADLKAVTRAYLAEHPADDDEPVGLPVTRRRIERVVADLFVSGAGKVATRLVLTDDARPGSDLGGWCRGAIVDRLCAALGIPLKESS